MDKVFPMFFGLLGTAVILLFVGAIVYGYANNVIQLVTQNESTVIVIARFVGMFLGPVGVVLGYF